MTILVATCQQYVDVIVPFVVFFNRQWPDCPYRRILVNSPLRFEHWEDFQTPDRGWTANILRAIAECHLEDNLLILLDDYMLTQRIPTEEVAEVDQFITNHRHDIGSIRLVRCSDNQGGNRFLWPSHEPYNETYNVADMDRDYKKSGHGGLTRIPFCYQPAIWNIDCVKKHFNPQWTPWEQEIYANRELCDTGRINGIECPYKFLTTKADLFSYCNAVAFGRYSEDFLQLVEHTIELVEMGYNASFLKTVREIALPLNTLSQDQREAFLRDQGQRQLRGEWPARPKAAVEWVRIG